MKRETDSPADAGHRDNDGLHKRRGIWYYSLEVNGNRRFFSAKTRNYQDARKKRAEAIKQHVEGKLPTDKAKWLFEKLLGEVCEDRKLHLSESSIAIDKGRSSPLLKFFSGRRACEIDNDLIRDYQRKRQKQVSNRTINLETKLLRSVLKAAKIWGQLVDDYKPLPENSGGPGRALEEDEEKLLFDTARSKPGWDAAFYAALIASNTTMRGCELKGLHLRDVNLMDREIIVSRSKTDGGTGRRIPLTDAALWACARLIERARALGATNPEHYVFPACNYRRTKTGKPVSGTGYDPARHQKSWRTAWRNLTKAAGLRGLRFHDLRHTCITKLAESEASDQTIMSIAGHLDRKMLEHYSHIRNTAKRKAIEAMRGYVPEEMVPAGDRTTLQ